MIKVTPFIQTIGDDKFKEFLHQTFKLDMLYPISNEKSVETLFADWRGKDMLNWYKFTNGDGVVLEFYSEYYIIKNKGKNVELLLPKTINEFINDMAKFDINIYWTIWVDEEFEPKQYLHKDYIKQYYIDLLEKMGKSFELL